MHNLTTETALVINVICCSVIYRKSARYVQNNVFLFFLKNYWFVLIMFLFLQPFNF